MAELPIATQCGTGAPGAPPLDSGLRGNDEWKGSGASGPPPLRKLGTSPSAFSYQSRCSDGGWCRLVPAHEGMKMRPGRWRCLGVVGATLSLWIPASARMTNSVAGDNYFRTNRSCRLVPAHQGMKSGSCGLVQRIGTVDSADAPPRPLRGTSPSPREVFDRATFSHSAIGHRSTIRHVSPVESRHRG